MNKTDFTDSKDEWLASGCGPFDTIGKSLPEISRLRAIHGELITPVIAVYPPSHGCNSRFRRRSTGISSWAWDGYDGEKMTVEVYGCGSYVELYLNCKKLGRKFLHRHSCARFHVRYHTGMLTGIVYDRKHCEKGRSTLHSADSVTLLKMEIENNTVMSGKLFYVRLRFTDQKGITKILQNGYICISIVGGILISAGNTNEFHRAGNTSFETKTCYGEAFALIKAGSGKKMTVTASSENYYIQTEVTIISDITFP